MCDVIGGSIKIARGPTRTMIILSNEDADRLFEVLSAVDVTEGGEMDIFRQNVMLKMELSIPSIDDEVITMRDESTDRAEDIRIVAEIAGKIQQMCIDIGDGCEDGDMSNVLLENAYYPGDSLNENISFATMAGQAYENLSTAYHVLHRAWETLVDLVGIMEAP